jgi:hypothetical protein
MPTYGPNITGTAADLGASWTSPGNLTANDASFATWTASDGAGGCFLAGTRITTPDGFKLIEHVEIDNVLLDAFGDEVQVNALHFLHVNQYMTLIMEDGSELHVTAEHPFLKDDVFVKAEDLSIGDTLSGKRLANVIVRNEPVMVFNLSVNGSHTFVANGLKVHNK